MRSHFIEKRSDQFPEITFQDIWEENCSGVAERGWVGCSPAPIRSSNSLVLKGAPLGLYWGPRGPKSLPPPGRELWKRQAGQRAWPRTYRLQLSLPASPQEGSGNSSTLWGIILSKQPQQSYPAPISAPRMTQGALNFPWGPGSSLVAQYSELNNHHDLC